MAKGNRRPRTAAQLGAARSNIMKAGFARTATKGYKRSIDPMLRQFLQSKKVRGR
jgi:hypothetical protein